MAEYTFELLADHFWSYLRDAPAEGELAERGTPDALTCLLGRPPATIGAGTTPTMTASP